MNADRPPRLRLFDILDAIHQTQAAIKSASDETFGNDIVTYRAVERWLEIISEASRHVGDDLKQREGSVEWRQIANFGNIMRHGYEAVARQIIWNIVTHDLPVLKAAAARLYASVKLPTDPWPDAESE